MLSRKRGVSAGDAHMGPERKPPAFRRAAAVFFAAAVSVALASGCGAPLVESGSAVTMPLRPRPSVRLLDWPQIPEATDESLESFERLLENGYGPERRSALLGISDVYSNAGGNRELRERCFEILLRAVKTGVDSDDSALAVLLVSRLSLLNNDFTYSQRMQAADLLISALRSGSPSFWHRQATDSVPMLSLGSAARLEPKETDRFIEIYRQLLAVTGDLYGISAMSLESISRNPGLSSDQISRIYEIIGSQLALPDTSSPPASVARRLPDFFRILATLATHPRASEEQAQRIRMQIRRFSDCPLPLVRGSARFYIAYISMGDKSASDQELSESAALLLKSREENGTSLNPSVTERLLTAARANRNPAYFRRNAYRMLRSYLAQGGIPPDFPSERLLQHIHYQRFLERDNSVRFEVEALISAIQQP